jgi:hypothetical protein
LLVMGGRGGGLSGHGGECGGDFLEAGFDVGGGCQPTGSHPHAQSNPSPDRVTRQPRSIIPATQAFVDTTLALHR